MSDLPPPMSPLPPPEPPRQPPPLTPAQPPTQPQPLAPPPMPSGPTSAPPPITPKKQGIKPWVAIVIALVLVGGGVGAWFALKGGDDEQASPDTAVVVDTEESTATTPPVATEETIAPQSSTAETIAPEETVPPFTLPDFTVPVDTVPAADVVPGAPSGQRGDHANPVPAGTIADIGGGWRLQVLDVNPDGASVIAAENPFNEAPPAGSSYTMVRVALGYFGTEDPKSVFETTLSGVGSANVELTGICGLIPDELDLFGEVFSGGVLVGNLCFVTTPDDLAALQISATGDFFSNDRVFLDARATPAGATPMAGLSGPQDGAASTPGRRAPTAIGTAVDVGEGWSVAVMSPAVDITDAIMTENTFNAPPPDGYRYIGVNVAYAYNGSGAGSPFSVSAKAVGASNVELSGSCGVVPGEIDPSQDVFAGGSVTGTICFVAPGADPSFVLYVTASFVGDRTIFATA